MAEDWIKLRVSLRSSPKILRLAAILKVRDPDLVRAKVENLWMYADTHARELANGDALIALATFESLDHAAGMRGLLEAMSDAAIDWARQEEGGVVLPRFHLHQPRLAKKRADDSRRQRERRSRHRSGVTRDSHAETVTVTRDSHGVVANVTLLQDRTVQDRTKRKDTAHADTPAVQAAPAPRAAAEQSQQQQQHKPAWDGSTSSGDARRVQDAWNRARPARWIPASVNHTRGLYAAVVELARENPNEPDPVGLLIRRIDEYRGSREGREFPASLKKFLAGKHLESLEQWDHAAPEVERPRGFKTSAERAEERARQIEAGATA